MNQIHIPPKKPLVCDVMLHGIKDKDDFHTAHTMKKVLVMASLPLWSPDEWHGTKPEVHVWNSLYAASAGRLFCVQTMQSGSKLFSCICEITAPHMWCPASGQLFYFKPHSSATKWCVKLQRADISLSRYAVGEGGSLFIHLDYLLVETSRMKPCQSVIPQCIIHVVCAIGMLLLFQHLLIF